MKYILILLTLFLTGCATVKNDPNTTSTNSCPVYKGRVVQVNDVDIVDNNNAQTIGTAVGAYAGNKASDNEVTKVFTTLLGGVMGSAVGEQIDRTEAVELFIQVDGDLISIPQRKSTNQFEPGDAVWIVGNVKPARYSNSVCNNNVRILPVKGDE